MISEASAGQLAEPRLVVFVGTVLPNCFEEFHVTMHADMLGCFVPRLVSPCSSLRWHVVALVCCALIVWGLRGYSKQVQSPEQFYNLYYKSVCGSQCCFQILTVQGLHVAGCNLGMILLSGQEPVQSPWHF